MRISLLSIGTELLNGRTINTNATFLAKQLSHKPFEVIRNLTIPDTKEDIFNSLDYCLNDSDLVITTGGLGPTNDDITKKTISDYFNLELFENKDEFERLDALFTSRGRTLNKSNLSQVLYPKEAKIFVNDIGTASAFMLEKNKKKVISFPGVPNELKHIFTNKVYPFLNNKLVLDQNYGSYVFRLINMAESVLFENILDRIEINPDIDFAFYPNYMLVDLVLKGKIDKINKEKSELRPRFADHIYTEDSHLTIEKVIADILKKRKKTLAVAESCTGGLLSSSITKYPGVSDFYKGAIVSYANEIKTNELKVDGNTLKKYGAVSVETAEEMANNIRKKYNVDYAISTTGIAGPEGGTEEKPVGTVCFALASESGTEVFKKVLGNQREMIQKRSVQYAFYLLWKKLNLYK